jgi:hypothetical protein
MDLLILSQIVNIGLFFLGWPFYPFMIAAACHLLWQILTVNLSDPYDCNKK